MYPVTVCDVSSINFGIVGVAGYVAPRHLAAIAAVGGRLSVAQDIADSARALDKYFADAAFFTDIDLLERHLATEARSGCRLDYLSICSPNHLHDAHIRFALRNGADAICEKPVVINPWNLDHLREQEEWSGRRVWCILQLRLLPRLIALREQVASALTDHRFSVDLSYITERGGWYFASWKGKEELSGGVATNIGIHFFDLLQWIFGPVKQLQIHVRRPEVVAGTLVLERADVRWFMSVDANHLPDNVRSHGGKTYRSITVDGEEIEFTNYGAVDLHTAAYRRILSGQGFGLNDAEPSIQMTHDVRTVALSRPDETAHPKISELDS